jgi:2-keto-4-pentenoate hydratase
VVVAAGVGELVVDGRETTGCELRDGDVVEIGGYRILVDAQAGNDCVVNQSGIYSNA